MKKLLKTSYKKIWVPVMGRVLSILIPWIEGKAPKKIPTFDIDGDQEAEKDN